MESRTEDFTLHKVIDELGVEAIAGAVVKQYGDELAKDYIG